MKRGDVCQHGIRWPWACHECHEAAWAEHFASVGLGAEHEHAVPAVERADAQGNPS
jgi:hypothetical protein